MTTAITFKSRLRILQLKAGAKVNRVTNRAVECTIKGANNLLSNTLVALDEKQDKAYEVFTTELNRIAEETEARRTALKTALSRVNGERNSALRKLSVATDV